MSRAKFINKFKQINPNLNKTEINTILNIFCETIKIALKDGKKVELRGFGTFFVKTIQEKYSARNPRTGKLIYVPKTNKIRFKASKKLNKLINK